MNRIVAIFGAILISLFVSNVSAESKSVDRAYVLGAGDQIEIIVFNEPNLSIKLMINNSGIISYPLIGQLQLAGKTPEQVANDIRNKLKNGYLKNPMVTVRMLSFRDFYVSGEVKTPGGYEYRPGLTLEQAVAIAGGFTDRADRDDVAIRRTNGQLIEDALSTQIVFPGDTIIIDQSFF
ncbi:TPA: polysaccharide biosynthesis/export family protein [Photobacterium damselae]